MQTFGQAGIFIESWNQKLYIKVCIQRAIMKKTIALYTLGCRLNQAESAVIERQFEQSGYRIVDSKTQARWVIINTCTVTEKSDRDTRRIVNKLVRQHPKAKIVLVGCQAQIQGKELLDLPNVHLVVDNASKMQLVDLLDKADTHPPKFVRGKIDRAPFTLPVAGIDRNHTRANIKIQDGCSQYCTFCEIPFARGPAKSREFDDILNEAQQLARAGHREIVITGINVGTFAFKGRHLDDVIRALESIEGIDRIRLSSLEPTAIAHKVVELMQKSEKLCRFLHLPIQYGSDRILKAMRRNYTVSDMRQFIEWVHKRVPGIAIGTDIIVGFPGETQDDFQETVSLISELPLAYLHVFSYSERRRHKSRLFPDKVDRKIIAKESQVLRSLSQKKRHAFLQQYTGKTETVLFEQKKQGFWNGLTDNYIRVNVKSNKDLANVMLQVELQRIDGQAMIGTL
jgi:threonylcarbamoyladenosine tRNA methylthiotransferase MtaB